MFEVDSTLQDLVVDDGIRLDKLLCSRNFFRSYYCLLLYSYLFVRLYKVKNIDC